MGKYSYQGKGSAWANAKLTHHGGRRGSDLVSRD
jgi:hypothetical protein